MGWEIFILAISSISQVYPGMRVFGKDAPSDRLVPHYTVLAVVIKQLLPALFHGRVVNEAKVGSDLPVFQVLHDRVHR